MLAHLRTVIPTIILALALSGCGFSGALYLPGEPPPAPEEQPAPESAGDQPEAPPV